MVSHYACDKEPSCQNKRENDTGVQDDGDGDGDGDGDDGDGDSDDAPPHCGVPRNLHFRRPAASAVSQVAPPGSACAPDGEMAK